MAQKSNFKTTFSNDATKKLQGFDYQKLIALECCINAKKGDIIYIECYGDVYIDKKILEIKLHQTPNHLTDQNPDFWKTLKNFVKERKITTQCTHLILSTTSDTPQDSIFNNWNKKDENEKYQLISSIKRSPNEGIKEYVDEIFSFNTNYKKADLLMLLKKFQIFDLQPNIKEKYNLLLTDRVFLSIKNKKHVESFLDELFGYITRQAIVDNEKWHVFYDEFKSEFEWKAKKYHQDDAPFPVTNTTDITLPEHRNFLFIEELKKINHEKEIELALIDYIRADVSTMQLIDSEGKSILKAIEIYEDTLFQKIKTKKDLHATYLNPTMISTEEAIIEAKRLYLSCKQIDLIKIQNVQPIDLYFQNGKMHKVVDDGKIVWRFIPEDFS